ncbi:MAG: thioesterase [Anaerostipes sp.]|jgi:medium-chain acyl-[acyl-carrier-protein] hydrolase|nr:thioesterase [Anaerostipes sp.]
MYTFEGKVRYSEVDRTGKLPAPGIINYFQDCSVFQSEELGVGVKYLLSQNRAWMLCSWQVIFEKFPKEGDFVATSTWASGFERIHGIRNFTMRDKDGELFAYANSYWVYMDVEAGKPIRASQEEVDTYKPETPFPMENASRKIKVPKDLDWTDTHPVKVQKSWIDSNQHVNNNRYIYVAWNALSKEPKLRQIRVEYKKAAKLGDMIIPKVATFENKIFVSLCDEIQKPYAVVEITIG